MKITIDLDVSLEENASRYFESAKKSRKKLEGARKALEEARNKQQKKNNDLEKEKRIKDYAKADKTRKKEWYEKYRWFISSDGFLVIGGRDADTNEAVIKKHAEKNDVVFHTDSPGSPFVVLKNPENKEIPDTTKNEAAVFAATFSKAWDVGIKFADVFEVTPEQVTKEAKSGEYMKKGAFMIYGKRKEYKPQLSLAIGILKDEYGRRTVMSGPESAIAKRCSDFMTLRQGDSKKGEISKKIMKKFGLHTNEDILSSLPAGKFSVAKQK